ncbi:uncharacterized protein B0H18DRAFT_1120613 [Fomitopsis serialis]|uniref:uncharacterized protein n=1 Tax=Fomitopsis serialis TaxID=139415 RepID=UPI002008A6FA|nr:uncharacterized protein B0H18DRAFT_1120613 [Neoantrodia serialis]KAH9923090.1 hypothetical protein B0H18DRAFT_1120613 [Neoantrodia serialis]
MSQVPLRQCETPEDCIYLEVVATVEGRRTPTGQLEWTIDYLDASDPANTRDDQHPALELPSSSQTIAGIDPRPTESATYQHGGYPGQTASRTSLRPPFLEHAPGPNISNMARYKESFKECAEYIEGSIETCLSTGEAHFADAEQILLVRVNEQVEDLSTKRLTI